MISEEKGRYCFCFDVVVSRNGHFMLMIKQMEDSFIRSGFRQMVKSQS